MSHSPSSPVRQATELRDTTFRVVVGLRSLAAWKLGVATRAEAVRVAGRSGRR